MSATVTAKAKLALRKKEERAHTSALWARLELLVPNVDEGYRSQALKGRSKDELLKDVMHALRLERGQMAPGALEQAYTSQSGAGLIAIELRSGKVVHQSSSFQDLATWIPEEARGNIRVSLEARDGDNFQSFCQSVVKDAGEPYGESFLELDKVVGRAITVRFFTRAPGPPGLRNPEWLLMMRAVKLTLVGVQPGESTAAGMMLPFFGQKAIPEAIGVFAADLSGGMPSQWTVLAAHVRNLLDAEVAPGNYDLEVGNMKPLETLGMLFNFEFSRQEGGGASLFSSAAQLGASALNLAQRSVSWLTSKALTITHQFSARLNDDDTVEMTTRVFYKLHLGLSISISMDFVGGNLGYSHGGLDFLYLIADPSQPLDGNLRAAWGRVNSAKTPGEFDVHHPFVATCTWGSARFHFLCKMLKLDMLGKKKMLAVEDVSQLFDKLKSSQGGSLLSSGKVAICVGDSLLQTTSPASPGYRS
jgi:hypothetical protein